ncbi:MAG: hypothetical protein HOD85_26895 [Deltaproteobacteria bacterium]|jgi:hypothetical protein|nr:hypothetical protein [Deltaproteobacteria bacterium]MBT4643367.1 hypothetical protein [Deltaproteobacteria bacterium]
MISENEKEIIDIIDKSGPMLSTKLINILESRGLNRPTARQRIHRCSIIKRLELTFTGRQSFIYLSDQLGTRVFHTSLRNSLDSTGSTYGSVLHILDLLKIIPEKTFPTFCGNPFDELGSHIVSDEMLRVLIKTELVSRVQIPGIGPCISVIGSDLKKKEIAKIQGRLKGEELLIKAFEDWSEKLGIVSFEAPTTRESKPDFCHYNWDFVGPSYVGTMPKCKKGINAEPNFVIADIIGAPVSNPQQIKYFLDKVKTINHLNHRPYLAFLIANKFERKAFNLRSSVRAVFTTPEILFGKTFAIGIKQYIDLFTKDLSELQKDPNLLKDTFKKLEQYKGVLGDIRGKMFEIIVGETLSKKGDNCFLREIITHQEHETKNTVTEIDVLAKSGNEKRILVVECKGILKSNKTGLDEVKKWFEDKVPIVRSWLFNCGRFPGLEETEFEFWTTGEFSKDALDYMEERKMKLRNYCIDWKEREQVLEFIRKHGTKNSLEILNVNYKKDP